MDSVASAPPIVVVDDEAVARELITRYLRKLGLRNPVLEAADVDSAIEILRTTPLPALVLLDVVMPGRSGLELLEWLRAHAELRSTPVLMLTVSAELEEVDRAYALGISAYLVKPVGYAALEDVIRHLGGSWLLLPPEPGSPT